MNNLSLSNPDFLLFGIYPYLALTICLLGSWVRYDLAPYTWKAQSSQLLRRGQMRLASNMFHIGIIFVLCGHFVGLLTPHVLYEHLISAPQKQMLAMVSGGGFGLICLVGLLMLLCRRLMDARVRASSGISDTAILFVLLTQLLLGLSTIIVSSQHLDGSEMLLLANWAQALASFHPQMATQYVVPVPILFKVHILLGLSLFILFPFTRLVHIASVPVWYFGRKYQIVRQR